MRQLIRVMLAFAAMCAVADAQSQLVRVTVPKANVRSEPSDKAPVLQQATPKDQIEWKATEGDWFKVLLPPNPALGGARVEAYISKKVAKLEAAKPIPVSAEGTTAKPAELATPAVPAIDTHAANVFLGSIVDGTLLKQSGVQVVPNGNRDAWMIQNLGDWRAAADKRPSFVVSIGDRAPFPAAGLAPAIVRLTAPPAGVIGNVVGSTKAGKDWKSEDISLEMTQGTAGVWNLKPSKDLKPGDYAIVMRPVNSKAAGPEIAWAFTVR
jgi:hypothetical protein